MSNNIRHLIIQPMNEPKKIEQMSIIQQKKKTRGHLHIAFNRLLHGQKNSEARTHVLPHKLIISMNPQWTTNKTQFEFLPFLSKYISDPIIYHYQVQCPQNFYPLTTVIVQSHSKLLYTIHQWCIIHHVPIWDGLLQNPVLLNWSHISFSKSTASVSPLGSWLCWSQHFPFSIISLASFSHPSSLDRPLLARDSRDLSFCFLLKRCRFLAFLHKETGTL